MRLNKDILRLRYEMGKTEREIRDMLGIKSKTTVHTCIQRAENAGLSWPLPAGMTEDMLELRLFPYKPGTVSGKIPIDFAHVHAELQRKDTTKSYLWEQYAETHSGNHYGFTQFCELYNKWANSLNYSMKQTYKAGEKVFVDFGDGLSILDPATGEYIKTHIFVSVLGASKYTYTEAVLSQDLPTWIRVNRNMFEFYGGVPEVIVPDNLKSAVEKACRYEPLINRTYQECARHYGAHVAPTRPYEPRDKAHVENGVKLMKRWVLIRLRDKIFYSLAELNAAIREVLEKFNDKIMKKIGKSRKELFLTLDKPNMMPLPAIPFEFAEWKKVKPGPDYHVSFEKHLYSVPYTQKGQMLEIRATDTLVEIYKNGERMCSHKKSHKEYGVTTVTAHMPESHMHVAGVTAESLMTHAEKIGPFVLDLIKLRLNAGKFPEYAFRSCLGILRLAKKYSNERLNKACKRAIHYKATKYHNISTILQNNLEGQEEYEKTFVSRPPFTHSNIRGKQEYEQYIFDNNQTQIVEEA
jgi:transposase